MMCLEIILSSSLSLWLRSLWSSACLWLFPHCFMWLENISAIGLLWESQPFNLFHHLPSFKWPQNAWCHCGMSKIRSLFGNRFCLFAFYEVLYAAMLLTVLTMQCRAYVIYSGEFWIIGWYGLEGTLQNCPSTRSGCLRPWVLPGVGHPHFLCTASASPPSE